MLVYNVGATPCACPLNGAYIYDQNPVGAIPCGCPLDNGRIWDGGFVDCPKGTHKGHPYGAYHV